MRSFFFIQAQKVFTAVLTYLVGRKYSKRSHAFAKFVVLAGMLPKMLQRVAKLKRCAQLTAELVGSCFAA